MIAPCPQPTPAEVAALREQLAAQQARASQLEATVHRQAQSMAELTAYLAARAVTASPSPSPGRVTVTGPRHRHRAASPSPSPSPGGVTASPPSITAQRHPSVTDEDRARLQRERKAANSRAYRLRHRGAVTVTAPGDGDGDAVTPKITQEEEEKKEVVTPPPPSSVTEGPVTRPGDAVTPPGDAAPSRGRLRLAEQVAARQARTPERPPAKPGPLPPAVQALRAAWDELVAPYGFEPWPARTSAQLREDAQAALAERPLAEWREVFARVPRSPLCRGELNRKQRADLLWLLRGTCPDGHCPADKLLTGGWSLDSPPSARPTKPEPPAPALPGGASSPAEAWQRVLASVGEAGQAYALTQLEPLRPRALVDGELRLLAEDRFRRAFVEEQYGPLLREHAARCGLAGVRVDVEGSP